MSEIRVESITDPLPPLISEEERIIRGFLTEEEIQSLHEQAEAKYPTAGKMDWSKVAMGLKARAEKALARCPRAGGLVYFIPEFVAAIEACWASAGYAPPEFEGTVEELKEEMRKQEPRLGCANSNATRLES